MKEGKLMSTLNVPGVQLFYEVSGSGPLLILIPGARGDGAVFRPLAHHLSAQYQVVTYDRRGFSRSSLAGPAADDQPRAFAGPDRGGARAASSETLVRCSAMAGLFRRGLRHLPQGWDFPGHAPVC